MSTHIPILRWMHRGLALVALWWCCIAAAQQNVDLAPYANTYGVDRQGTVVTGGGLDGLGDSYAAGLLGAALNFRGINFSFLAPGPNSAVSARSITLPGGKNMALQLLATGVRGNQLNQDFVVTYTDGSSSTFTRNLSDWYTPQQYLAESIAIQMPGRITPTGALDSRPFYLYAYSLPLDSSKIVRSLTLPANRDVVLLSANLIPAAPSLPAVPVSLTSVAGIVGIAQPGTPVPQSGLDGSGDAYDANLVGTQLSFAGALFNFGAPDSADAASDTVIPLPAGKQGAVTLLATGVRGNQINQTFTVTYSDGSKTAFVQSLSDWFTPQRYPGESFALTMANRVTAAGATDARPFNLYGYTFTLDATKTVQSITLPANRDVVVLAMDVIPAGAAPVSVTLTASSNVFGIDRPGTPVSLGGIDAQGNAYAANLLGTSLSYRGATFVFAPPGPGSALTSKTLSLPAGLDSSLTLLATGVDGNQTNQTFIVNYTDGTRSMFVQSLSDWFKPQSYSGESVAVTTADRITSSGATDPRPFNLYAYSFTLDSTKTVQSLTLPNNPKVVVLAVDVTPAGGGQQQTAATPSFSLSPGTYNGAQSVSIADSTAGAAIYYTTNGSPPGVHSNRYSSSLVLTTPTTIKAIAVANGYNNSAVASATYTITPLNIATPSFSLASGTYSPITITALGTYGPTSVAVSEPTPNTLTYYTTDLSNPMNIFPELYYTPIPLAVGITTIKAIAFGTGNNSGASSAIGSATYTVPPFPSDLTPLMGNDSFLHNNVNQRDSCSYYRNIGAVTDPPGQPCLQFNGDGPYENSSFTFADWKAANGFGGSNELHATFVNVNDLNFTRDHHAVMNLRSSAAYVCNFRGPDFYHDAATHTGLVDQAAVDAAISAAQQGFSPLPCVAIDYNYHGNGIMRFLVFNSSGQLIPQVDLDGRGPKQIPNACSACHGVPAGAAPPAGGYQQTGGVTNGSNYMPFDMGSLEFSSQSGLTRTDQEAQIKALNLFVLNAAGPRLTTGDPASGHSGDALTDLIHGWYDRVHWYDDPMHPNCDAPTPSADQLALPTQQLYAPCKLLAAALTSSANLPQMEYATYLDIYAPLCRSCHIANGVKFPLAELEPLSSGDMKVYFDDGSVCNPATATPTKPMPNAKVTFDRFWTSHVVPITGVSDLPTQLVRYYSALGATCNLDSFPRP